MNWTHTSNALPKAHNRPVLVYHGGSYHVAKFDKYKKGFVLSNGKLLSYETEKLHWTELSPPQDL